MMPLSYRFYKFSSGSGGFFRKLLPTFKIKRLLPGARQMRIALPALFLFALPAILSFMQPAAALETWESLDRQIKGQIYQINVGVKLKLGGGLYAQLSDLSPGYHYPVFTTSRQDKGFRVLGFGTAFPIKTSRAGMSFFITNRHVVQSGNQIINECRRFFAAIYLYAEQTSTTGNTARRFDELLSIVNFACKKDMTEKEKGIYQATVDTIWDIYEKNLSWKADPKRIRFLKYLDAVKVNWQIAYFLHAPGPASQVPLLAHLFKVSRGGGQPDLAVLTAPGTHMPGLEFDTVAPSEGQEIQVIGYPSASKQIDACASGYYAPAFNNGRIIRVAPRTLQVDAPITKGNSGAPVINRRGKVIGVASVRAVSEPGYELSNFGGAVTVESIRTFAPELFGKIISH